MNEIILILLVAVGVAAVWVARATAPVTYSKTRTTQMSPGGVIDKFMNAGAASGFTPTMRGSDTLALTKSFVPGLAILFAIVLFPIGLLLLLIRSQYTLTVTASEAEGSTRYTTAGKASRKLHRAMQEVMGSL